MIPKHIILTHHTKPDDYISRLSKWNPDFEILFFDDLDCEKFIQAHFDDNVLDAFKAIKPGAYKADLFRYCAMYVLGGIYTDAYIPYQRSFASLWNLSKDYLYLVQDAGEGDSVQISTMAAPRGCHYYQLCLQQSVKNIKERAYRDSPYSVTGPVLAGECLKKYLGVEGFEVGGKYIPVNQSDENACIDYRLMRIDGEAALRLSRAAFFDANEQYLFPYKLNQKRKNWESLQHYYNAWHARDIYH